MVNYVQSGKIQVAQELYEFINSEALPGTNLDQAKFWADVEQLISDLAPKNKALLEKRLDLQRQIDEWHKENRDLDFNKYKSFLEQIGYLEPEVEDFTVSPENIDSELENQAGPQLVVPVDNARYAINAANARWGSLYDALYGTDIISEEDGAERSGPYNPVRGDKVIAYAKNFLDEHVPLASSSHTEATKYAIVNGSLEVTLKNGETVGLKDNSKFVGYQGESDEPRAVLLVNHRLHIEIQIDREDEIGSTDPAGIKDIYMESTTSTIMDCEDSVTAVDAQDKTHVYRNWLGLVKGDLTSTFVKDGKEMTRELAPDRTYTKGNGESLTLSGRVLMLVRNVGHLMTNNAMLDENGEEVPEGIMDGIVTSLIAKHDILGNGKYKNGRSGSGSIYIVKPKMHGSEEVQFANELFNRVEDLLELERNTLKMGVMDEERRTSLNLKNCIHAVKDRIFFINTGFLDRTGDEIHTAMEAGPMIRKGDMRNATWLNSYEKNNVRVGLQAELQKFAQIGKGMWAMPDLMADMLEQKIGHLQAGGNTAWVPSPTAATIHALHYHMVDVEAVQAELERDTTNYRDDVLQVPVAQDPNWSDEEVQEELDNSAQTLLGYVVRWIDHGVGCSKVPDINDIGLMEDRATLRISSQMLANWLHHDICTEEQVMETLKRMAEVVDKQNADDPLYRPMAPNFDDSIAFQAACDLVFKGKEQPSGYTEPILHSRRLEAKAKYGA